MDSGLSKNKYELTDPRTWVDSYGNYLYNYTYQRVFDQSIAEELVQDTFLAALKARDGFKGNATEKTWLTSILRNKIFDYFRKSEKEITKLDYDISQDDVNKLYNQSGTWKGHWDYHIAPGYWRDTPITLLENKEFLKIVDKCIKSLPDKLGQVLALAAIEELEFEKVCNDLKISSSNLRVRLHRARQLMRRCLDINWFKRKEK